MKQLRVYLWILHKYIPVFLLRVTRLTFVNRRLLI